MAICCFPNYSCLEKNGKTPFSLFVLLSHVEFGKTELSLAQGFVGASLASFSAILL